LRQITQEEAAAYLREPAYLIQVEQARHEEFSKHWHVNFDFNEWNKVRKQRSYDWIVVVKGLVSFSKIAHGLVVHDSQQVGGLEESWQLGGNARVLNAEQVSTVYQALAPVSVTWANEDFSGQTELFEDFQDFLKEAFETGKALLIIVSP
jgi:hypothetical protein